MPHDHHDHDHDHPEGAAGGHPTLRDDDAAVTYWQRMEIAVRELLIEKGVTTAAEIAAQIDLMDSRSPANGAAVVARAWSDPDFRTRLLQDAAEASREMGFDIGPLRLIAVENTADTHNLIVCTLC
ncbi:MAG: nitrile hydratase subunit alpha, partial [Gemmobacter sp.]